MAAITGVSHCRTGVYHFRVLTRSIEDEQFNEEGRKLQQKENRHNG